MGYEKIMSIKPLTKLMVELLQDYYNMEKHNLEPTNFYDPILIKGLLERGLIKAKQKNDEQEEQYMITDLGREYMKHYFGAS